MRASFPALILTALCCLVGSTLAAGSFRTGEPAIPIPDDSAGTFACQDVIVPADGTDGDNITALTVTVTAEHSWVGDTTVQLTGPNCGPIRLHNRPGRTGTGPGGASNLCSTIPLTYDDGAATDAGVMGASELGAACIGSTGPTSYFSNDDEASTPMTLTTCEGTDAVGIWTLCMEDAASGDTGTLTGWTLDITTDPVELLGYSVH